MSLLHHVLPLALVAFVWWAATGLLIYADGLPERTFRWTFTASTALGLLGLAALGASSAWVEPLGAAVAFGGSFLVWMWLEASFYTGYVTGLPSERCREGCRGWKHLGHAIRASLYHEIAVLASLALVWWFTRGGANDVGLWTFVLLTMAHQSARLNVFLGVRNVTEVFLPEHLLHLRDFVGPRDRRHPLLPVTIAIFTIVACLLAVRAATAGSAYATTASAFLAATAGLAAAEHWALALPIRVERLWEWSLSSRAGR